MRRNIWADKLERHTITRHPFGVGDIADTSAAIQTRVLELRNT